MDPDDRGSDASLLSAPPGPVAQAGPAEPIDQQAQAPPQRREPRYTTGPNPEPTATQAEPAPITAAALARYLTDTGWRPGATQDSGVWTAWTRGTQQVLAPHDDGFANFELSLTALVDDLARHEAESRPSPSLQVWRDMRDNPEWIGVGPADLAAVRPDIITDYLLATGWRPEREVYNGIRWSREDHTVRTPHERDQPDAPDILAELLRTVAEVEERPSPAHQIRHSIAALAAGPLAPSTSAEAETPVVDPDRADLTWWTAFPLVVAALDASDPHHQGAVEEVRDRLGRARTIRDSASPLTPDAQTTLSAALDIHAVQVVLWQLATLHLAGLDADHRPDADETQAIFGDPVPAQRPAIAPEDRAVQARTVLGHYAVLGFREQRDDLRRELAVGLADDLEPEFTANLRDALGYLRRDTTLDRVLAACSDVDPLQLAVTGIPPLEESDDATSPVADRRDETEPSPEPDSATVLVDNGHAPELGATSSPRSPAEPPDLENIPDAVVDPDTAEEVDEDPESVAEGGDASSSPAADPASAPDIDDDAGVADVIESDPDSPWVMTGIDLDHPIVPQDWGWAEGQSQQGDDGFVTQAYDRGDWSIALTGNSDEGVLTQVFLQDVAGRTPDGWDEVTVTDRADLEELLTSAGRFGVATPTREPGTWTVTASARALTEQDADTAAGERTVYLDDAGQWRRMDTGLEILRKPTVVVPDLRTHAEVTNYVLGERQQDAVLRDWVTGVVTGRARGGVSPATALERLHSADHGVFERAVTAAAARPSKGAGFDFDRARHALQRLADDDPTLPIRTLGSYVELREFDRAAQRWSLTNHAANQVPVRGVVVEVVPDGTALLRIVIERDVPAVNGAPRATDRVAADAAITVLDPAERPALADLESARAAMRPRIEEYLRSRGLDEVGPEPDDATATTDEPATLFDPAPAPEAPPAATATATPLPAPESTDDARNTGLGGEPPSSDTATGSDSAPATVTWVSRVYVPGLPVSEQPPAHAVTVVPVDTTEPVPDAGVEDAQPAPEAPPPAQRFRPATQNDLAPSGEVSRLEANLAALWTLRTVQAEQRPATPDEQAVLARWSGWGAVTKVFDDDRAELEWARTDLRELLSEDEIRAAARNTINAHYTDLDLVQRIWHAVQDMGFTGGQVLEPGCGSGNFLSQAPDSAHLVGVELEPTSAAIAALLTPQAQILTESFADTRAPQGTFDLTIGNVPFGDVRLVDRTHNGGDHKIHNHFIIKSLNLTKPGGLVAVLTSRYTLDAQGPGARREMATLADLVGAVRLPSNAHQRAAGTKAVTDLLILRRREPDREPDPADWEQAPHLQIDSQHLRVNQYFHDHPDMVLGEFRADNGAGMYREDDLSVVHPDLSQLGDDLAAALRQITEHAREAGLLADPVDAVDPGPVALVKADSTRQEGTITVRGSTFARLENGIEVDFPVPSTQVGEMRALLRLRDTAVALLNTEAAHVDDVPQIGELRADLNRRYDAYYRLYGAINRFTWRRTGRTDPETGDDVLSRVAPPLSRLFRLDPHAPTVLALESFDPTSQTAAKMDIFTQRVVAPRSPKLEADSPADAVAICWDTFGELRLDEIARLLGTDEADVRQQLGTLVYDDPATEKLVTAAEYLSGNVRNKLRVALDAAERDARFDVNVDALRDVIPIDLTPEQIRAPLGAVWIPAEYIQAFLRETLQDKTLRVDHPGATIWTVRGREHGVTATEVWGTGRMAAPVIAQHLLEQQTILIYDTVKTPDGETRVLNPPATADAQAKAEQLNERFQEWIWADPERAEHLAGIYNERFNASVARSFAGVQLTLPGKAITFTPKPHQVEAVARMIADPAVLLAHEVGAGKTGVMAIGVMELRRLGLVRKPTIVVPNNMLDQFGREFAEIYPQARLLIATKADFQGDQRRKFVARCATGDWDAVIMTKTAFERIPMSPDEQRNYLNREVEEFRKLLASATDSESDMSERRLKSTVKKMEKQLLRTEERLKKKLATDKDAGLTFEGTGIDYIVVDEAHLFKNLRTMSKIEGAGIDGSNRSSDLHMKLEYLRSKYGNKVGTFATATPIANSITEAHVMQRYLRPNIFAAAGVESFDAWASTFGQAVTALEISPDSTSFRMKTRFAKFQNVPELVRMFHQVADIKTAEDLKLPVPELLPRPGDGKRAPEIVQVPASPEVQQLITDAGARAGEIQSKDPRTIIKVDGGTCDDSMLLVSGDGRRGALDMRLLTPTTLAAAHVVLPTPRLTPEDQGRALAAFWDNHRDPDTGAVAIPREQRAEIWAEHWEETYGESITKLVAAADRIATRWLQHRDDVYPGADGADHPTRGSLQFVFSDLGTPSDKWNVYDELRDLLVARSVPKSSVRFIHEAMDDQAKGQMFADARSGKIAVLVGSTEKMGVGTNAQRRAVALSHLDCPWRPADVQQRNGRAIRQGNLNAEIEIEQYVTEGSFDAYMWQTVGRKAEAIAQVMRGRLDVREIEDIGDAALNANEAKAIATGNTLLLKHAEVNAEVTRLERRQRSHDRSQDTFAYTIRRGDERLPRMVSRRERLEDLIASRQDTRGDAFAITIRGTRYTKRPDAGDALKNWLIPLLSGLNHPQRDLGEFATLGAIPLTLTINKLGRHDPEAVMAVGSPDNPVKISLPDLIASKGAALIIKLENGLDRLDRVHDELDLDIARLTTEVERAHDLLGEAFPLADALAGARAELADIDAALRARAADGERELAAANARKRGEASADQAAAGGAAGGEGSLQDMAMHDVMGMAGMNPATATVREASLDELSDETRALLASIGVTRPTTPSDDPVPAGVERDEPEADPVAAPVEPEQLTEITSIPIPRSDAPLLHLSREEGLVFRTAPGTHRLAGYPLMHPRAEDGGPGHLAEIGTWEQVDPITWRKVGTPGTPITLERLDQAQAARNALELYRPTGAFARIDYEIVADEPVDPGVRWDLDAKTKHGLATVRYLHPDPVDAVETRAPEDTAATELEDKGPAVEADTAPPAPTGAAADAVVTEHAFTPDQIQEGIAKAIADREFRVIPGLIKLLAVQDPHRAQAVLTTIEMPLATPAAAPSGEPAVVDQQPTTSGLGRRRLHFSTQQGAVLYDTIKGDRTGEAFKTYRSRNYRKPGNWTFSHRIENGTPKPGAWYIPKTINSVGTDTTAERLACSAQALRQAGYTLDIDINTDDFNAVGRYALKRLADDLASDPADGDGQPSRAEGYRTHAQVLLDRVMAGPAPVSATAPAPASADTNAIEVNRHVVPEP